MKQSERTLKVVYCRVQYAMAILLLACSIVMTASSIINHSKPFPVIMLCAMVIVIYRMLFLTSREELIKAKSKHQTRN